MWVVEQIREEEKREHLDALIETLYFWLWAADISFLLYKLIMATQMAFLVQGSSLTSPRTPLFPALPSQSLCARKYVKWGMERKDGTKWVNHKIASLHAHNISKRKLLLKPLASAPPNAYTEDYVQQADFYKVEAILRPWRIPQVTSGLLKIGIRGVTVCDVKGFGAQGASPERQGGSEFSEDKFVSKVKMEIVVSKDQVEAVIDAIIDEARTGEIGDGKIFVVPVVDIIRVRTGERGLQAERMTGGRAELLANN